MSRKIGIYGIRNKINGKIYVGKSTGIGDRFTRHRTLLKHNKHYNLHLQRSYNKYGSDVFEYVILEECNESAMPDREQYWIDANKDKVYNGDLQVKDKRGRNNSFFGKNHSESTKRKMAFAKNGKYLGANNPNYGKSHSHNAKQLMATNRATKLTPEKVIEIKRLLSEGVKHLEIANQFDVARTVITRINSGARWSSVH